MPEKAIHSKEVENKTSRGSHKVIFRYYLIGNPVQVRGLRRKFLI